MKASKFIDCADNDKNLFVVYYAGHGRITSERQAEWLCKRSSALPTVTWSGIQTLFADSQSDVLILLDACAAASATEKAAYGSMEAIMACGFGSIAPPPGEHSFTNALIDVLEDWVNKRSFSASCLHAEILTRLKMKENRKGREGLRYEWCTTPVYINCSQDSKASSIELCRRNILPRASNDGSGAEPSSSSDATELDTNDPLFSGVHSDGPRVIISIALEESQPDLDVTSTVRWLKSIPLLAEHATVEAVYGSYSTLLILSVAIPVWNLLPDYLACSFIGFITSPNLFRRVAFPESPPGKFSLNSHLNTYPEETEQLKQQPILEASETDQIHYQASFQFAVRERLQKLQEIMLANFHTEAEDIIFRSGSGSKGKGRSTEKEKRKVGESYSAGSQSNKNTKVPEHVGNIGLSLEAEINSLSLLKFGTLPPFDVGITFSKFYETQTARKSKLLRAYLKGSLNLEAIANGFGDIGKRVAAWWDERQSRDNAGFETWKYHGGFLTATELLAGLRNYVCADFIDIDFRLQAPT